MLAGFLPSTPAAAISAPHDNTTSVSALAAATIAQGLLSLGHIISNVGATFATGGGTCSPTMWMYHHTTLQIPSLYHHPAGIPHGYVSSTNTTDHSIPFVIAKNGQE